MFSRVFRRLGLAAGLILLAVEPSAQTRGPAQNRMTTAIQAVVGLTAFVPEEARSAKTLGTERSGSGIIIDSDGLILTVGYLILEANRVVITTADDQEIEAKVVAFDFDTGFGLVRAPFPGRPRSAALGSAERLKRGDTVYIASRVGDIDVAQAAVVSRREFAGYWEYLLADAIFTTPQYPTFGGAPLFSPEGTLIGVGSLAVRNAGGDAAVLPGNMFIPIDHLKPVLADLLTIGRRGGKEKPWFGIWTSEVEDGGTSIGFVAADSPAQKAGLRRGDVITKVEGEKISGQADLYRKIWAAGEKTSEIAVTIRRGSETIEQKVVAVGRSTLFKTDPGK